jgi:hypothetical protein
MQGSIKTTYFAEAEKQLLRRIFSMLLAATACGKNAPKYGARHKSCSIKYAVKISAEMLVKQNSILL